VTSKFTFLETASGLCLEDAGPTKLASLLKELDKLLGTFGIDLDELMEPGINEDEIRAGFAEVGLVAPEELVVLYRWHNGVRDFEVGRLYGHPPFFFQSSLETAVWDTRYNLAEMSPEWWASGWFSIEQSHGLAVYCTGDPEALPLIRRHWTEAFDFLEESTSHQTVSLSTMVALWIDAIAAGLTWPVIEMGHLTWGFDGPGIVAMDAGRLILV
jgi:hypothetical protein